MYGLMKKGTSFKRVVLRPAYELGEVGFVQTIVRSNFKSTNIFKSAFWYEKDVYYVMQSNKSALKSFRA